MKLKITNNRMLCSARLTSESVRFVQENWIGNYDLVCMLLQANILRSKFLSIRKTILNSNIVFTFFVERAHTHGNIDKFVVLLHFSVHKRDPTQFQRTFIYNMNNKIMNRPTSFCHFRVCCCSCVPH